MPKVIALLNQKGGVGKTTLAVHIATALARKGRKVLLLDADPQGSALDWAAARQGAPLFPVVGLPKSSIHKELPTLAANFEFVIIDGPPRVYDVARSAIMASDLVLIPVQPSPYDVWAAKEIMDLLNDAAIYKPGLKKAFVINRKIANTAIGRDVAEALSEYPLPVLHTPICQRVAFAESATQGLTVYEIDPEMIASQEMSQLADEVERMIP
jgi:chromosome partitioning protein